jgi:hypothetical protein
MLRYAVAKLSHFLADIGWILSPGASFYPFLLIILLITSSLATKCPAVISHCDVVAISVLYETGALLPPLKILINTDISKFIIFSLYIVYFI